MTHQEITASFSVATLAGDVDCHIVRRPWRKRLFSLPWRPWIAEQLEPGTITRLFQANDAARAHMQEVLAADVLDGYEFPARPPAGR